jgi:L-cysteate sulfo-lyase
MKDFFAGQPRLPLVFSPTPLYRAERLSEHLGIDLWLKRDDLTGPGVFGGNKMRKLEFLLGSAKAQGIEYVFTFGATQSNHAMETAAACRRWGFKPVLYLVAVVEPDKESLRGNLLLDALFGAEVHIVNMLPGETEDQADDRALEMARVQMKELESQGHPCMEVPIGGSNLTGAMGFAAGYCEFKQQQEDLGLAPFDYIFHSTGSGGTMAGLLAGQAMTGGKETIISVSCSKKGKIYEDKVLNLANSLMDKLGQDIKLDPSTLKVEQGYYGEGYEIPSEASTEALKLMARMEGVVLDPVYTAKAFAGLLDYVKTGKVKPGQRAVFWHTGGASSLFAEPEIVGNLQD